MLPEGFDLGDLDLGIKRLVIALNRIPGIYTMTTCEGHVWRDIPAWPAKDGWVHFIKPDGKHDKLIKNIKRFCLKKEYFRISEPFKRHDQNGSLRTISGMFESHESGSLFDRMNEVEKEEYYQRADGRKIELLSGWNDLGEITESYIIKHITPDIESLPYV